MKNPQEKGLTCPFNINCMYCRPWFVVSNPILYIISQGQDGYECKLPEEQYIKKGETPEQYHKRMEELSKIRGKHRHQSDY